MSAPKLHRPLLALLALALLVAPGRLLAAPGPLQTTWSVDTGNEILNATGTWTFEEGSETSIGLVTSSTSIDGLPPTRVAWLPEIVLATQFWRWVSAAAPTSQTPGLLTGGFSFDFGQGGSMGLNATVDLGNESATLDFDLANVDLLSLPSFDSAQWVEIQDQWTGGQQGGASTSGCVIIQGMQVATFSGGWFDSSGQDTSFLPTLRTDAALWADFSIDEKTLDWVGDLRLGQQRSIQFGLNIDAGNGPQFVGFGSASLDAASDARQFGISTATSLNTFLGPAVWRMLDLWWMQVWARLERGQSAWPSPLPDDIQAAATFDLGAAGKVDATADIFLLQDFVTVTLDVSQIAVENLPAVGSAFEGRWRERFVGLGGGEIEGDGDLFANGMPYATFVTNYQVNPPTDTSVMPNFLLDTTVDLQETNQGLQFDAEGVVVQNEEAQLDLVHQLDLGVTGSFSSTSLLDIQPRLVPGDQDPRWGGVEFTGSLQMGGDAYPARALALLDVLDLAYWIRRQYRPIPFPPEVADSSYATIDFDFGMAGNVTIVQELDAKLGRVESDADAGTVNLAQLPEGVGPLDVLLYEQITDMPDLVVGCPVPDSLKLPIYLVDEREVPRRKGQGSLEPFQMVLAVSVDFAPDGKSASLTGTARFEPLNTTAAPESRTTLIAMGPAHPNPSPAASRVQLTLGADTMVRASVIDVRGRRVRSLLTDTLPAGSHSISWDGRDERGQSVAGGSYWLRLEAAGEILTRKIVRLDR